MNRSLALPAQSRALAAGALLALSVVAIFSGPPGAGVAVGLLMMAAYYDLRLVTGPWGHGLTFLLGAGGVAGFLWSGYQGDLAGVPAVGAALVVALVISRVVLHEAGVDTDVGITSDVAATLAAVGIAGVSGAHVLLIRGTPGVGFRGLLVFLVLVAAAGLAAALATRLRGRHVILPSAGAQVPRLTWESAVAATGAALVAGLMVGLTVGQPFDVLTGLAFGAGSGLLWVVGSLSFEVLRADTRHERDSKLRILSGTVGMAGPGFFVAPAFYWAFRTIAL